MRIVTLATCTLNQWAMDFAGNFERIKETILEAKKQGAAYRCGPELEVTGYGCADHFYETDTFLFSWEVIAKIMEDERCSNIIIDIGMPVMHKNIAYNCRVLILNKKVLLIRPKKKLCDSAIYRESRWFTGWAKDYQIESFKLPSFIQEMTGQVTVPIGDAVICTSDTCIGFEICEELWNPESSLITQLNSGVEITVNSSGGFHEIGRTKDVVEVIKSATKKCGGIYLFSNLRGCDGDKVYYHGTSHITTNGDISAMGEQFSLRDTETVIATLDLDDIVSYRRGIKSNPSQKLHPIIEIDWCISSSFSFMTVQNTCIEPHVYNEGEEVALGPACWLWDYLRRSNANSILLSLDGDIESCSSALIVYSMCNLICKAIDSGNLSVLSDVRKIVKNPTFSPSNPEELCSLILVTCQLSTEEPTDDERINSNNLAKEIGCSHYSFPVEKIIHYIINITFLTCSKLFSMREESKAIFGSHSTKERIKMVTLYLFSEILSLNKPYPYRILVLGTGNADKILLGNYVKYGKCSGDISLTGGITERNLKQFLRYCKYNFKLNSLDFKYMCSTTEDLSCRPVETTGEIYEFCKINLKNCGPSSTFCRLVSKYDKTNLEKISREIKNFFHLYSLHRHKNFSVAPCFHIGAYATVNSYYNQHQVLYDVNWTWQFNAIDRIKQTYCIP